MAEDETPGIGRQVTGSLKEAIGKVTGDAAIEAEGRAELRKARGRQGRTGRPADPTTQSKPASSPHTPSENIKR